VHVSDPTLHAAVIAARERLLRAGLSPDLASIDAEVLAREALGWDRARYLAQRSDRPPAHFERNYEHLLQRREAREPVSQILGRREFWGRDFEVSRAVLTPRPETELIVESALVRWPTGTSEHIRVVDVGTGSGCLAVTLASEWPAASVIATDISADALAVAARNAKRHGVEARVHLIETNLLDAIEGRFDLIVSNPPYVPEGARPVLPREVRDYEPAAALFGGPDGFRVIEALLDQTAARLGNDGVLIFEFGAGRDDRIQQLLRARPSLQLQEIREDLQDIPRVAIVRRAIRDR
jgi:release factor glutamine methyltransferase